MPNLPVEVRCPEPAASQGAAASVMAVINQQAIVTRLAHGDMGDAAATGRALEAVVADTFCLLDGVGLIKRNVLDNAGSLEVDILLYNQRHPNGLPFYRTTWLWNVRIGQHQ